MIDIHSHVVPNVLPFGLSGDDRWPTVSMDEGRGRVEIAGKTFRVVREVAWNMDARIDELHRRGISFQAISPMPELFSYWADGAPARDYCSAMNEWIGERVRERPDFFAGLGIVPLQDVDAACELLSSVRDAGLVGVEIGSNIGGISAGNAVFTPFYVEAARLGLCIFIHTFHPVYEDQVPHWAVNGVTFPLDIGFATEALIVNKILAAAPSVRIAVSHGGGTAAFAITRLQFLFENSNDVAESLGEMPVESLKRLYYDSLLLADAPLRYLLNVVGPERICVGTDFPFFGMGDVLKPVVDLDVDAATRQLLEVDNARRFLGDGKEA